MYLMEPQYSLMTAVTGAHKQARGWEILIIGTRLVKLNRKSPSVHATTQCLASSVRVVKVGFLPWLWCTDYEPLKVVVTVTTFCNPGVTDNIILSYNVVEEQLFFTTVVILCPVVLDVHSIITSTEWSFSPIILLQNSPLNVISTNKTLPGLSSTLSTLFFFLLFT